MAAISGAIPNLIGGVSQQPPEIRSLNCSTALINTWSDVATGLSTRPAGRYVGKIGPAPTGQNTVATYTIQKPSGRYHIAVYDGSVHVYNMDTKEIEPVTVEGSAGSYIDAPDAAKALGFCTVGDTTFIWNREKVVTATKEIEGTGTDGRTEDGTVRKNPNRFATFWVKQRAGYMANYTLYHNNELIANKSTDESSPTEIAENLAGSAAADGRIVEGITNTIKSITLVKEGDFITAGDDFGGQAVVAYNDHVDEFTDLPNSDKSGRLVLIRQSFEEDADDYWVWRKDGSWQETYGWNAYEKPDNHTMPVILVDNRDGTWTLKETDWPGRTVGDVDSNPSPSFIDRTINSMFLYKGRMVILSDENFLASRVGDFENFYRSTCTQLLDDDPIDIASPESRGAEVVFAKTFDRGLLLMSKFDQFRLDGDGEGLLSPNTVSIRHANSYNVSPLVEPVFIGPNLLFVDDFNDGGFSALREYQVERVFGREVALSVTDQIPEYIPSGVYKMVGSSTRNVVGLLTTGRRTSMWLYNYYFSDQGKVQSSWQEWQFSGTLFGIDFVEDKLVVTIAYDGDLHLLSHAFESGADLILDDDSILLDYGLTHAEVDVARSGNDTFVSLPFTIAEADHDKVVLVMSPTNTGTKARGRIYKPTEIIGETAKFSNLDLTGDQFSIGLRFRFFWKLSPLYVRDGNLVAIQDGRLQLRRISFLYNHSGPFKVHVTPEGRQTYTSTFSGFILGKAQDTLNGLSLDSGEFKVGANGLAETVNVEVEAWTPWRVRFSSLEWDGSYRARKRRTT